MSTFATPTSEPSGFDQVGSPDALTSQSGMVSGLNSAADAWDTAASTLTNVASALVTDSKTLAESWESTAATAVLNDLNKTINSANHASQTFHQYAQNLRVLAAYIQKIRNIKAELHNIWRLILVDLFVGLAAIVLGFVASEIIGAVLPVLGELAGSLFSAGEDASLTGLVGAETIPTTTDSVIDASELSVEDVGEIDSIEPTLATKPDPAIGGPKPVESNDPVEPTVTDQPDPGVGGPKPVESNDPVEPTVTDQPDPGVGGPKPVESSDPVEPTVTDQPGSGVGGPKPVESNDPVEPTVTSGSSTGNGDLITQVKSFAGNVFSRETIQDAGIQTTDNIVNGFSTTEFEDVVTNKVNQDLGFGGTGGGGSAFDAFLSALEGAPLGVIGAVTSRVVHGVLDQVLSPKMFDRVNLFSSKGLRAPTISDKQFLDPIKIAPLDPEKLGFERQIIVGHVRVIPAKPQPVRPSPLPPAPHPGQGLPKREVSSDPFKTSTRQNSQGTASEGPSSGPPRPVTKDTAPPHHSSQPSEMNPGATGVGTGTHPTGSAQGAKPDRPGQQSAGSQVERGTPIDRTTARPSAPIRPEPGGSTSTDPELMPSQTEPHSTSASGGSGGGDRRGGSERSGGGASGGDRRGGGNQGASGGSGGGDRRGGGNQGASGGSGGGDRRGGERPNSERVPLQRSRKIAGRTLRRNEDRASLLAPTASGKQEATSALYDSEGETVVHDPPTTLHSDLNEGTTDVVPLASKDIQNTINHSDSYADVESGGVTKRIYVRKVNELRPSGPPVEKDVWKLVPVEASARPFVVKTAFASVRLQGKYHSLYEQFKAGAHPRAEQVERGDIPATTRGGPHPTGSTPSEQSPTVGRPPASSQPTERLERLLRVRRQLFKESSVDFRYERIVRRSRDDAPGKAPADPSIEAGRPEPRRALEDPRPSTSGLGTHPRSVVRSPDSGTRPAPHESHDEASRTEAEVRRLQLSASPPRERTPSPDPSRVPRSTSPSTPRPTAASKPRSQREIERERIRQQFWQDHERREPASPVGSDFSRSPYVPPAARNPRELRTPTRTTRLKVPESVRRDRAPEREGPTLRELAMRAGPKGIGRPNEAQRRLSKVKQGLKHYTLFHATDRSGEEVVGDTNALLHILERHRNDEFRVKPTEIKRLIEHADFHGDFQDAPKGGAGAKGQPTWTRIYFTHERTLGQRVQKRERYHVVVVNRSTTPRRVEQAYGGDAPPNDVRLQARQPSREVAPRSVPSARPPTSSGPSTSTAPRPGPDTTSATPGPRAPERSSGSRPSGRKQPGPRGGPTPRRSGVDVQPSTGRAPAEERRGEGRERDRAPGPRDPQEMRPVPTDLQPGVEVGLDPRQQPVPAPQVRRVDSVNWYRPVEGGGPVFERTTAPGELPQAEYLGTRWIPAQDGGGAYVQEWRFIDEWGFEHVGQTVLPGDQAYLNRWHVVEPSGQELIGETLLPPGGGSGGPEIVNWFRPEPGGSFQFVGSSVLPGGGHGATFLGTVQAQPPEPSGPPFPPLQ